MVNADSDFGEKFYQKLSIKRLTGPRKRAYKPAPRRGYVLRRRCFSHPVLGYCEYVMEGMRGRRILVLGLLLCAFDDGFRAVGNRMMTAFDCFGHALVMWGCLGLLVRMILRMNLRV